MNTKKIKVIMLLMIAVSFIGCNITWQRYVSKEYEFAILLPRLWYIEEGTYNTVVMATAPSDGDEDKFQENINVAVADLPAEMEGELQLDTYFELSKNEMLRTIPGEETDITEGEIFSGKVRGKWLAFNSRVGGVNIRTITASWLKGVRVYIVSCSAAQSSFEEYEPAFQKALHSLEIR